MRSMRKIAYLGVSLFALSSQAYAQAPAAEGVSGERDIVVSARRRDEDAQDVPVVVQAVTTEQIGKLNLRKFEDISSVVPGLTLASNANGIGVTATVRGVNYDVNVSGNNGTIQFYQNDVPVPAGLLFNALFDVGQIEVLRGPQGTLKGRSAPSGQITLYTHKPNLAEVGANFDLTVNDQRGFNVKAAMNIPVIADKLAVRISGVVAGSRGSNVRDLTDFTIPSDNSRGIRASAKADPFDGVLNLDFTYQNLSRKAVQFLQSESGNQVLTGSAASPVRVLATDRKGVIGLPQSNDQGFITLDWSAKLHFAGQALTYVGGRAIQHLGSFAPTDIGGVFTNDSANGVSFGQPTNTRSLNTSHEIRLQNEERIGGIFDYVAGALFAKGSSDTTFLSVTGIAIGAPFSNPPRLVNIALTPIGRFGTNDEKSVFGSLTAHLGTGTEVSGGLRHISYHDVSGLSVNGTPNPLFARDAKESYTIYQASIKQNFGRDLMIYASTGTSWRPSTIAIGGPTGGISALQLSYLGTPPETSRSYELGFKSTLLDNTLKFNMTAFYQKFKNYPYRSPSGIYAIDRTNSAAGTSTPFNYVAAVPVTVKGVETELSWTPSKHFKLGAIVSYSKGTIANGTVPCLDLNGDGVPDTVTTPPTLAQLQAVVGANNISSCKANFASTLAPRWSGSIQSEFSQPLQDRIDGYIRGLFTYKGNSLNDPVNAFDDVKSYGLLNLYAGMRETSGAWEISFYGKNITNTFRVLTTTNGPQATQLRGGIPLGGPVVSSGPISTPNYYGITVTEPREFGVNFRIAIGSR